MKSNYSQNQKSTTKEQKFGKTIWEDFRRGDLKRTFRQDFKDIYSFYLDEETRKKLDNMGRFKRLLYRVVWIGKSLVLKLTPARRVLLVIALLTFVFGRSDAGNADSGVEINLLFLGFIILLIILALELKDKLLAQNELAVGRAVQFALLPKQNPKWPGWEIWLFTRPANEVGGDLVDYLQIDEKRLGITLGDVAGKGLGAALYMAKLQATLRALAPTYKSFSKLGEQMNTIFCNDGLKNRFVSLVYLELEPNIGLVRVLNAGHLPPLILRGTTVEEMPHGFPALGIQHEATYKEQQIRVKQGELVLAYSDGLTEARNEDGKFYGEQSLFELLPKLHGLSTEALGQRLLQEVERFTGEARPNDDLSLMLLKYVSHKPNRKNL